MAKFGFAAVGFLVVMGAIFAAGFIMGGSWGTGMETDKYDQRLVLVDQCMETDDADQMRSCVAGALQ